MELTTKTSSGAPEENMIRLRARWLNKNEDGVVKRDAALAALRESMSAGRCDMLDLRGISLREEDLRGIDFSRCDLAGADLTETNLSNSRFAYARLTETQLAGSTLESMQAVGADFSRSNLTDCKGALASFGACNMTDALFFGAHLNQCTFSKAKLANSDFRTCDLSESRFCDAELEHASFAGAILHHVDFTGSNVTNAVFNDSDLRESILRGLVNYRAATWVNADIRQVDFCGAYLLRRHIMDENYLYEFKNHSSAHAKVYWIWRLTSDCGRSLFRWGLSILAVVLLFAALYTQLDIDYGKYKTSLSPIYFSIVTITTLGYGDAVPVSVPAQIACMLEVVAGYMALGGMLSIFANKMARRAE